MQKSSNLMLNSSNLMLKSELLSVDFSNKSRYLKKEIKTKQQYHLSGAISKNVS